jgi:hypothetical protein
MRLSDYTKVGTVKVRPFEAKAERAPCAPMDSDNQNQQMMVPHSLMNHHSGCTVGLESKFCQMVISGGNMTISRDDTLNKDIQDAHKLRNALGFCTFSTPHRFLERHLAVSDLGPDAKDEPSWIDMPIVPTRPLQHTQNANAPSEQHRRETLIEEHFDARRYAARKEIREYLETVD